MNQEEVLQVLHEQREKLRRMGVKSLALFGSIAREDMRPGSDIDLLVELEPPYTYDRYIRVKFYLEDLFQQPVDLVMADTVKPLIQPYIEKDAIYVP